MSEDELRRGALEVFESLRVEFPALTIEIQPNDPNVDVSVEIPQQAGLDFRVSLNFQNRDELHMGAGQVFWCSWFPSSDPRIAARYRDAVVGVLSGRTRIVEYRHWGWRVGADLEVPSEQGWTTVARSGVGLLPRWGATKRILQNRRAVQQWVAADEAGASD